MLPPAVTHTSRGQSSDWTSLVVGFIAGVGGFFLGLWSGFPLAVQALAVASVFDFVAGVTVAIVFHEFDSGIGARGLVRKGFQFCIVLLVAYLQRVQLSEVGIQMPAAEGLALAFTAMEVVSILRHYRHLGGDLGPLENILVVSDRKGKVNRDDESDKARRGSVEI